MVVPLPENSFWQWLGDIETGDWDWKSQASLRTKLVFGATTDHSVKTWLRLRHGRSWQRNLYYGPGLWSRVYWIGRSWVRRSAWRLTATCLRGACGIPHWVNNARRHDTFDLFRCVCGCPWTPLHAWWYSGFPLLATPASNLVISGSLCVARVSRWLENPKGNKTCEWLWLGI